MARSSGKQQIVYGEAFRLPIMFLVLMFCLPLGDAASSIEETSSSSSVIARSSTDVGQQNDLPTMEESGSGGVMEGVTSAATDGVAIASSNAALTSRNVLDGVDGAAATTTMEMCQQQTENAPTLFHLDQDLDQDLWDMDVSDEEPAPPSALAADVSPSASCAVSGATNMYQKDIDDEISTQQLYAFSSVTMSPCPAAVRRGQGKDVCDQSSNHSAITSSNSFLKTGGIVVRSTCLCCESFFLYEH